MVLPYILISMKLSKLLVKYICIFNQCQNQKNGTLPLIDNQNGSQRIFILLRRNYYYYYIFQNVFGLMPSMKIRTLFKQIIFYVCNSVQRYKRLFFFCRHRVAII